MLPREIVDSRRSRQKTVVKVYRILTSLYPLYSQILYRVYRQILRVTLSLISLKLGPLIAPQSFIDYTRYINRLIVISIYNYTATYMYLYKDQLLGTRSYISTEDIYQVLHLSYSRYISQMSHLYNTGSIIQSIIMSLIQ